MEHVSNHLAFILRFVIENLFIIGEIPKVFYPDSVLHSLSISEMAFLLFAFGFKSVPTC